ncbi:hypothetical protein K1719_001193 [Acacia pycnantha]|nr:hypothetical protein K1719_001193 [Acacia pycnantha]
MFSSSSSSSEAYKLPVKPIPGSYGPPFFGAIADRRDFFYNLGREKFFTSKIEKYQSTVFRTNMPPGPFIASDPRVVAVLDAVSFPILFDVSKVEKRDLFTGTYMPSTALTGGYRVCSYLDPSEPKHALIKRFLFSLLAARHDKVLSLLKSSLSKIFLKLEQDISANGEADFNTISDNESFNFVFHYFCGVDPNQTKIGSNGPKLIQNWLLAQLGPIVTLGPPKILSLAEDLLLHTFPFPPFLVKSAYNKVYNAVAGSATEALDQAVHLGLQREEAAHNLVFVLGFNTFGGVKVMFPSIMKWVGLAGEGLHKKLADEIRTVVKSDGGLTLGSLDKMTLTKSAVWEALRIEPPVPFQYAKAKEDLVVQSHDASFEIKKGEMIFGYQPLATKDPKVFERADEFVADRFVGEEGERLLKYVYWSNGRETEDPSTENKQCAGKNLVVLLGRLLLVEFFLQYDTFTIEEKTPVLGPAIAFKSLTKAN